MFSGPADRQLRKGPEPVRRRPGEEEGMFALLPISHHEHDSSQWLWLHPGHANRYADPKAIIIPNLQHHHGETLAIQPISKLIWQPFKLLWVVGPKPMRNKSTNELQNYQIMRDLKDLLSSWHANIPLKLRQSSPVLHLLTCQLRCRLSMQGYSRLQPDCFLICRPMYRVIGWPPRMKLKPSVWP